MLQGCQSRVTHRQRYLQKCYMSQGCCKGTTSVLQSCGVKEVLRTGGDELIDFGDIHRGVHGGENNLDT
jgi:hypothetical protein